MTSLSAIKNPIIIDLLSNFKYKPKKTQLDTIKKTLEPNNK